MDMRSWLVAAGAWCSAMVMATACGSTGSNFGDGDGDADEDDAASSSSGGFSSGGSNDGSTGSDGNDACEGSSKRAEKLPVNMLIVLDQSGSMGDHGEEGVGTWHRNRATRWLPVTTALSGFLDDPTSVGIRASLRYFPQVSNKGPSGTGQDIPANVATNCAIDSYAEPDVPLTPLPNAAAFGIPDNATYFGTPTYFATSAAVAEAEQLVQAQPEAKTVVVLVTDGSPAGCSSEFNNAGGVTKTAEAVEGKPFPTYVIGVGAEGALHQIAVAGGTERAFIVRVEDGAEASQAQFTAAIEKIREQALSCEVPIPDPPANQEFDRNKVNVVLVSGDTRTSLGYDPECEGDGWRYDNASDPAFIVLCNETCEAAKGDPNSQIDVEFGCTTRGPN